MKNEYYINSNAPQQKQKSKTLCLKNSDFVHEVTTRGLMDKTSDFESEDCGLDPFRGRRNFNCFFKYENVYEKKAKKLLMILTSVTAILRNRSDLARLQGKGDRKNAYKK